MTGIKEKISNLLHKDKSHDGAHSSHGTTPGAHDTHHSSGLAGATAGYDATTSTPTDYERNARTGMSDLDINKGSTGATTGLTDKHHTDSSHTGTGLGHSSSHTSSHTGMGTGIGHTGTGLGQTETGLGHTSSHQTSSTQYGTTGGVGSTGTGYGNEGISQGVTRTYNESTSEIIDQERFTKTEDHEVVIEKKAYELEHRPVEKKYVVETKYMGERAVPGKATELLSTDAREVEERVVEMPRGDRTIIVENVDVPLGMESAGRAINQHSTSSHMTSGTHTQGLGSEIRGTQGLGSEDRSTYSNDKRGL